MVGITLQGTITYPIKNHFWRWFSKLPKVGYVNSLEGNPMNTPYFISGINFTQWYDHHRSDQFLAIRCIPVACVSETWSIPRWKLFSRNGFAWTICTAPPQYSSAQENRGPPCWSMPRIGPRVRKPCWSLGSKISEMNPCPFHSIKQGLLNATHFFWGNQSWCKEHLEPKVMEVCLVQMTSPLKFNSSPLKS